MSSGHCMLAIFFSVFGSLLSITLDFLISADRLFSIIRPIYHTLMLSNRYVFLLIAVAVGRASLEYGMFFYGIGGDVPICSAQDPRLRNCAFQANHIIDVGLISLTIVNYLLTIPATRYIC